MQYCSLQHQILLLKTSHIHSWVCFLLWLHPFLLSGVISPLISSSIPNIVKSKVQSESVHSSQIRKGLRILSSQSQSPNLFDIPTQYFSLFPFTHTQISQFLIFLYRLYVLSFIHMLADIFAHHFFFFFLLGSSIQGIRSTFRFSLVKKFWQHTLLLFEMVLFHLSS